ncbi:hypothetical protein Pmar_PMAR008427 [Perkinsus marinus ATCC 50983]|uniref:Uncharacterized protein n=1 Tax=Perkinsus marinus (strain ATCC 50983 / TXsc) TaxID=423536 RepID=C5LXM0_PERM5|nr:hypothetical protein Pmar_PMAR008427 [Perkinsus marinus ATCC 50983]EEQ98542.1 hypothetical protein Pmar_PMAR008427 [Perkinsus marinus ATCC 50983]|eukprot:XP_002765825.1 hypothetical protein Pmar_PMAR008427 [Perkinsus marinus ATCC 50983]
MGTGKEYRKSKLLSITSAIFTAINSGVDSFKSGNFSKWSTGFSRVDVRQDVATSDDFSSVTVALDWSSWRMPIVDSPSKGEVRPADVGAGVGESVNLKDSLDYEEGEGSLGDDEDLDVVVLALHNECKGPFILTTLVKCCREFIRLESRKRKRRRL